MKQPLAIISLEKDVIDLAKTLAAYEVVGILDADPNVKAFGLPFLGSDQDWKRCKSERPQLKALLALDPPQRKRELLKIYGLDSLATLVAPDAYVSSSASLGAGCIVQRGVKIMPDVKIGALCKMNVNVTVHHDCRIGDFCTLAPGAQLLGFVEVEEEVFVGAGAVVLPRLRLGKGAVIGAGAVVTVDVAAGTTVVGVPAKVRP
jgi:sugar O-acyltransferase (sialic acid O-acetyltransferase NeuD family)